MISFQTLMDIEQLIRQQLEKDPTLLRLQNLNIDQFPALQQSTINKCHNVLALNLKENKFQSLTQLAKQLEIFTNIQIILLGQEADDDVLMDFATIGDLRVLDELVLNEDESLSQYLDQFPLINTPYIETGSFLNNSTNQFLDRQNQSQHQSALFFSNLNADKFTKQSNVQDLKAIKARNCKIDFSTLSLSLTIEFIDFQHCEICNFSSENLQKYQKLKIFKLENLKNDEIELIILTNPEIIQINQILINPESVLVNESFESLFAGLQTYNQFLQTKSEVKLEDLSLLIDQNISDLNIKNYLSNDGKTLTLQNLDENQISQILLQASNDIENITFENCKINSLHEFQTKNNVKLISIRNCKVNANVQSTLNQFTSLQYLFLDEKSMKMSSFEVGKMFKDLIQFNEETTSQKGQVKTLDELLSQSAFSPIFSQNFLSPEDNEMENLLRDVLLSQKQTSKEGIISQCEDEEEIDLNNSISDICVQIENERNQLMIKSEFVQEPVRQIFTPYSRSTLSSNQIKQHIPDIAEQLIQQNEPTQPDQPKKFYDVSVMLTQADSVNQVSLNLMLQQFHKEIEKLLEKEEKNVSFDQIFGENMDQVKLKYQTMQQFGVLQCNFEDTDVIVEKDIDTSSKLAYSKLKIQALMQESQKAQNQVKADIQQYSDDLLANPEILEIYQTNKAFKLTLEQLEIESVEQSYQFKQVQLVFLKYMSKVKKLINLLSFKKNQTANLANMKLLYENQNLRSSPFIKKEVQVQANLMSAKQVISIFSQAATQYKQNRTSSPDFINFFEGQFFSLRFGRVFADTKRKAFYQSVDKLKKQNCMVQLIDQLFISNNFEYYQLNIDKIQLVCTDLLFGSVFELDNEIDQSAVDKKVESFKSGKITRKYWEDALATIDPIIGCNLNGRDIDFDEMVGLVLIWKMGQDE